MVRDLKLPRQTLLDAIKRLEDAGLVYVQRAATRGRGKTNRYHLPWLQIHLLDPQSDKAIEWGTKRSGPPDHLEERSGPPDHLEKEMVRPTGKNGQVDRQKMVRSTVPNNTNNNRNSEPSRASKGAGGATKTAAEAFACKHAKNQAAVEASK